jgi:hypothetical protein
VAGSSRINSADEAIEKARSQIDFKKAENYGTLAPYGNSMALSDHVCCIGFASMGAVAYAHIVAKMLEGKSRKGAEISLAPNPKDIVRLDARLQAINFTEQSRQIWKNVVRSDAGHASGQLVGFLLLCLVCAFYTLPLSVISFVANLSAVGSFVSGVTLEHQLLNV